MVLAACAKSNDRGAAKTAERILLNMEDLYSKGISDAAANSRCYSAAISAWARSGDRNAVSHALALVDRMEENGKSGDSPHGKPNAHCYNSCIHAIAKSRKQGKAKLCSDILKRMEAARNDGYVEAAPTRVTYSTILNGE